MTLFEDSLIDVPKLFVDEALKHIGETGQWSWATFGQFNIEWCAAFVSAVAKTVGILNKCIYNTASAQGQARYGVRAKYGQFYKGPGQGNPHVPTRGDLIFFRWKDRYRSDEYDCDHVGIVAEVDTTTAKVTIVDGNTGTNNKYTSVVRKTSYSTAASFISGYFHPDWSLVGSIDPSKYVMTGALYSSATTRKDMTLREIGYLDSNYQPSIRSSNIKLSAINYTSVLASVFKLFAPQLAVSAQPNTDKLEGNCKVIVNYLISKWLNGAASCGIAGNIYHESSFNTAAVGDNGTSFGICQWHKTRGTAMKLMARPDWSTNLTGQLNYLWYELTTGYTSTLSALQSVSNTIEGCKQAADVFVRQFERPSNVDVKSLQRQATAVNYFEQITALSTDYITEVRT